MIKFCVFISVLTIKYCGEIDFQLGNESKRDVAEALPEEIIRSDLFITVSLDACISYSFVRSNDITFERMSKEKEKKEKKDDNPQYLLFRSFLRFDRRCQDHPIIMPHLFLRGDEEEQEDDLVHVIIKARRVVHYHLFPSEMFATV